MPIGFLPSFVVTRVFEAKLHVPPPASKAPARSVPIAATPPTRKDAVRVASPASARPTAATVATVERLAPPANAAAPVTANGPTAPMAAPARAPVPAASATDPQLMGFPLLACCATETTVPTTAPIAAPINAVHQGQQCPVGSFRLSGLSPT